MKTAIVILAAGASTRFGVESKLLADLACEPVIRRTVRSAASSRAHVVSVVAGEDIDAISQALTGMTVELHKCPLHSEGMGSSIAHGVRTLNSTIAGAMILPGDMPLVTPGLLDAMFDSFLISRGERIVIAVTSDGKQRNPVLWPRRFFNELGELRGPRGAKGLLAGHVHEAVAVVASDDADLMDIDTPEDMLRAAALLGAR